jgi:hypothetical protein
MLGLTCTNPGQRTLKQPVFRYPSACEVLHKKFCKTYGSTWEVTQKKSGIIYLKTYSPVGI